MRTLIINSFQRKKRNTNKIASIILKEIIKEKRAIKTEEIVLRDIEMKLSDGYSDCANALPCLNIKDEFLRKYLPKIPYYDNYLFITPIYCDNVTPLIKNFIDSILPIFYSDKMMCFKNKKVGVVIHKMAAKKD